MSQFIEITEPEVVKDTKKELIIGIDLGTTNSLVSVVDQGQVLILGGITPSIVALQDGEFIIGDNTNITTQQISSIKRLIGKNLDDLDSVTRKKYIFEDRKDKSLRIKIGSYFLSPEEISSKILLQLKKKAEAYYNQSITKAVITVPAYFDERSRLATKNAGILAGLEVVRILNEPTAAAVAYGLNVNNRGIYAVYDLGGGTFDVSILNLSEGIFHVLATAGNINFGGDDIDDKLYAFIKAKIANELDDKYIKEVDNLYLATEVKLAKELLTSKDSVKIKISSSNPLLEVALLRSEFEELIYPEIEATIDVLSKCIKDSSIPIEEIKGIILVGGSSRLLLIKNLLKTKFNTNIFDDIDPDIIVAQGAAIQAHNLSTSQGNILLDIVPISLGIEVMGGFFERIIHRNSATPISMSKDFTTFEDGQSSMSIKILQGEREMAKDCRVIGNFTVKNIPPEAAGKVKITITFKIDADGLLTVEAYNKKTTDLFRVEVNPSFGLSVLDMENILKEAILNQDDDIKQKKILQEKLLIKVFIDDLENAFDRYKSDLSELDCKEITTHINLLKDLFNQAKMDIISPKIKLLKNKYYKILDLKYSL